MNKEKLEKMNKIKFETIDPVDYHKNEKGHYRITKDDMAEMPSSYEDNQGELRERIIEIFETTFEGKKILVYEKCDIDRTNFGRYLKGNYGITKVNLIKFIIGAKISYNEAKELLILNETPLNPKRCRFDYIADLAISDGDELDDFMQELKNYGCKNIESKSGK